MKLIDKAAVVAEIKRLIELFTIPQYSCEYNDAKADGFREFLSFINTLEVKEVDLEKHLKEDIEDVLFDLDGVAVKGATHYLTVEDVKDIAKHFFKLGIQAQKGE